ncbi:MAG: phenylalanine--tRNA ligase subunit beta [Candidatus Spechtbacterales bacterium]|nr:phenylalanine--tRNA ligase subunit beta [Candidatus Spechtbacterales bacterium]
MKFSYNIIQELVDKKLPEPHKLADGLTMHAFEVEGIEKVGDDYILDIDILPNRAHDAASHIGVAREAAAFVNGSLKNPKLASLNISGNKTGDISINVENTSACKRYMAAVIKEVEVKESPKWLRDSLESLGLNSINNVVDAANYAMLITGQPLHVFDLDKIAGNKIIIRNAEEGEAIDTLDEDAFILDSSMLVIADKKDPLAIAGIKGGLKAEVNSNTKNLLIESAWFDPMKIRVASQHLGLSTDASWRFEHETPFSFPILGLSYVASMLEELTGGSLMNSAADTAKKDENNIIKLSLRPNYASRLLGLNLTPEKISSLLESVDFNVEKENNKLIVTVPEFRLDIEREEDVVEEVGRLFGYENIDPEMPTLALYPPRRNVERYWLRQLRRHLAASGFNEVYNYSFISEDTANTWKFNSKGLWQVTNPISEDFKYMRPSLLPNLAEAAKENLKFFDKIEIFEKGRVFYKDGNKNREWNRLSLAIAGKDGESLFYELKGSVEDMLHSLGVSDIWLDDELSLEEQNGLSYMHPARRAQIKYGDSILGHIGQLDPRIASSKKIKGYLVMADLNLEIIIEEAEKEEIYTPISTYPQSVRDISILVPKLTKTSDVLNVINTAGGKLLRDVDMFDYYEEPDSDRKSMAFHLMFQAKDRTLESEEVENMMENINKAIEKNEEWSIK